MCVVAQDIDVVKIDGNSAAVEYFLVNAWIFSFEIIIETLNINRRRERLRRFPSESRSRSEVEDAKIASGWLFGHVSLTLSCVPRQQRGLNSGSNLVG